MTSNNIPEEFPKKQKEDRICPNATSCGELYHCKHAKPHIENGNCSKDYGGKCIHCTWRSGGYKTLIASMEVSDTGTRIKPVRVL